MQLNVLKNCLDRWLLCESPPPLGNWSYIVKESSGLPGTNKQPPPTYRVRCTTCY
ncbi:hypothetical protein LEMLEM_LOCUS13499 [Lemmus lemmus]